MANRRPIGGEEGEIIWVSIRILKIGNESIEMAYLDGRGRQTIRYRSVSARSSSAGRTDCNV